MNQAVKDLNDSIAESIFSGDTTEIDESTAEIEKQLQQLKNARAGYQNQIQAIDTKASDYRQATLDR